MFVRIKPSGQYQYLKIVESYRDAGKAKQKVIGALGRLDRLVGAHGIERDSRGALEERQFSFAVERAVFLTVLHRLFASGDGVAGGGAWEDRIYARW